MPNTANTSLPFDRSHAFLIGINDYEELTSLKTAIWFLAMPKGGKSTRSSRWTRSMNEGKAKAHFSAVPPCLHACFSSDGYAILSIHADQEIRIWRTHKQVKKEE